jgi:hypothetical protein
MRFHDLVNGLADSTKSNPNLVKGIVNLNECIDSGE